MKKHTVKNLILNAMGVLPYILWGTLILVCILNRKSISVQAVVSYAPKSAFLAALALIALYAVKSLAIFFPLIVLKIAGGILFEPAAALVINTVGVSVMTALPYFVGRLVGKPYLKRLEDRYPKILKYTKNRSDYFFQSFFLRIISCLPGDVVSLYFGAANTPFKPYFAGSLLGIIPGVITATFMGMSILDPTSPMFVISVAITVLLSAVTLIVHHFVKKLS